jgi:hypothetical protein
LDLEKNFKKDLKKKELFSTKIMLLLYYLFDENIPESMEDYSIVFEGNTKSRKLIDYHELYSYHPIIRGSII